MSKWTEILLGRNPSRRCPTKPCRGVIQPPQSSTSNQYQPQNFGFPAEASVSSCERRTPSHPRPPGDKPRSSSRCFLTLTQGPSLVPLSAGHLTQNSDSQRPCGRSPHSCGQPCEGKASPRQAVPAQVSLIGRNRSSPLLLQGLAAHRGLRPTEGSRAKCG